MNTHVAALWEQAVENLNAAQLCRQNGFYRVAISRAYYAVKYAAEAVLLHLQQIQIKTHKRLRSEFGLHIVKAGYVCSKWGSEIGKLYTLRKRADYYSAARIDSMMADDVYDRAKDFLDRMQLLLPSSQPAT